MTAAMAIHPGVMDFNSHLWAVPFGPDLAAEVEVEVEVGSTEVDPRRTTFKI